MATPPTQLRIPHDLLSRIDWAAKAEGVTRTAWLLKAAEASLGVERAQGIASVVPAEAKDSAFGADAPSPAEPRARCTAKGCTWTTTGGGTLPRCPNHGFSTVERL